MKKTNFWNDAAKYGAIIAVVSILFSILGMYWTNALVSVFSIATFITLLFLFTKRRVTLYGGGEAGYSYGQCLKFIFWMMVFAGILDGAYEIVARNFLFPEKYEEAMNAMLNIFATSKIYSNEQLEMMVSLSKSMMYSPIWIMIASILSSIIKGVFFGLFVSAFTKRNVDVFHVNIIDNREDKA